MERVSIFDLTVEQIETIELAVGLPLTKWTEAPSQARLYAQIMATATGRDISEFKAMPVRALMDMVTVGGSDPNP